MWCSAGMPRSRETLLAARGRKVRNRVKHGSNPLDCVRGFRPNDFCHGLLVIRMYAFRTFAIVSSAILALSGALLSAQQQPRAVIDPVRTMEARYDVTLP